MNDCALVVGVSSKLEYFAAAKCIIFEAAYDRYGSKYEFRVVSVSLLL